MSKNSCTATNSTLVRFCEWRGLNCYENVCEKNVNPVNKIVVLLRYKLRLSVLSKSAILQVNYLYVCGRLL